MATSIKVATMDCNSKSVDRPSRETVKVRQGTGPRATVSVLFISVTMAILAGVALVGYFVLSRLGNCRPRRVQNLEKNICDTSAYKSAGSKLRARSVWSQSRLPATCQVKGVTPPLPGLQVKVRNPDARVFRAASKVS